MDKYKLLFLLLFFFLIGCVKNDNKEINPIKENSQELEMISAYKEAHEALER
jgi:hypothetical protein